VAVKTFLDATIHPVSVAMWGVPLALAMGITLPGAIVSTTVVVAVAFGLRE
jgi:hypothetical protein